MSETDKHGYQIKRRRLGEVWAKNVEKDIVTLEIPCDNLIPGNDKHSPKNGTCDLNFFVDCRSFEIKLSLKDDKTKIKTKYGFKLRQLPGPINRQKSSWDIKKGMIVVKLHKENENEDWTLPVRAKGIDQLNSDESS